MTGVFGDRRVVPPPRLFREPREKVRRVTLANLGASCPSSSPTLARKHSSAPAAAVAAISRSVSHLVDLSGTPAEPRTTAPFRRQGCSGSRVKKCAASLSPTSEQAVPAAPPQALISSSSCCRSDFAISQSPRRLVRNASRASDDSQKVIGCGVCSVPPPRLFREPREKVRRVTLANLGASVSHLVDLSGTPAEPRTTAAREPTLWVRRRQSRQAKGLESGFEGLLDRC
jgi:hypothetical protein